MYIISYNPLTKDALDSEWLLFFFKIYLYILKVELEV